MHEQRIGHMIVLQAYKMATSEQGNAGYEWEFVEPPAPEFDCEICHNVLREPFLTTCCGSHFCQACVDPVIKDGRPCPSCDAGEFTVFLDKKTRRKILSFDVRCPMWRRGCKWVGELGERSGHLDEKDGECQFVDIDCSNACSGRVQRRELPTHLEQSCPKRSYMCDYCPFEATFDVVTTQHWLVCGYFPLPCPNKCDVGRVERQNLEQHLKECSLQEVKCDFSYAGCQAKLQRKDFAHHMEENVQNHTRITQGKLKEVAAEIEKNFMSNLQGKEKQIAQLQQENASLREEFKKEVDQLNEEMKEIQDEKTRQIAEVQEALQRKDQQLVDIAAQMQEKDEQIIQVVAALKQKVEALERKVAEPYIFRFTMPNYIKVKSLWWNDAPCFYTHKGGYRLHIDILVNSTTGGMRVRVHVKKGHFDDQVKWPLRATVTLQLIDPSGGHQPYERSRQGEGKKGESLFYDWLPFITCAELEKYIHNDSLHFRVVRFELC